ncbi:ankyrin repeat-containing domain protein [Aspergillus ambiguus]|uniref:ankyrin repeat-containing domain protein n=1 Tax=Aspergillus ambiguus TaxID=176160 RepID=UPI003CCDC0B3
MEPVSTAAAALQLAGAAVKASVTLYGVITTIKNAPKEILNLRSDLKALNTLLGNLEVALKSEEAQRIVDQDETIRSPMENLLSLIDSCNNCCIEVTEKLSSSSQTRRSTSHGADPTESNPKNDLLNSGSLIREGIDVRRSIWWLFKRKGIFSAVYDLQQTKFLLSDSMGSITLILIIKTTELKNKGEAPKSIAHRFNDDVGSAIIDWVKAQPDESENLTKSESGSVSSDTLTQQQTPKAPDPHMTEELLGAVRRGTTPVVSLLLNNVDVNAQDPRDGRTALSIAAETGDINMAKLLLAHGASVHIRQYSRNCRDCDLHPFYMAGRNPLHWAAGEGHPDMVELLLEYGANPNSANSIGRPALQEAIWQDDVRSVRLLLDNGADVNFRNFYHGWRPIHAACDYNRIELIHVLLEYKPLLDVNVEFWGERKSPLQYAVVNRNLEIMKAFLSNDADPDKNGMWENNTALHIAAAAGWLDGIKLLLSYGASIDPMDAYLRETPLHKAARNLETDACQMLCARGADRAKRNVDGQNYQDILNCAQQYPDDWRVAPDKVYFLSI